MKYRMGVVGTTLSFIGFCVLILPIFLVAFIGFTIWELCDKKGSSQFWDHVNDPYGEGYAD